MGIVKLNRKLLKHNMTKKIEDLNDGFIRF